MTTTWLVEEWKQTGEIAYSNVQASLNYNLYAHVFNATGVISTRIVFLVPLLSVSHQQQ